MWSRILVTGADGMVGSYVEEVFDKKSLYLTDKNSLDVTDYHSVIKQFEEVKPQVILHLAAATDVDRCEKEPDWAFKTNVLGTQNVAIACQNQNTILIYLSTGGVFNGNKLEPYTEFDDPDPINVYSKTKWEGEKIIPNLLIRYLIVRAGWMIGGKEKDKKFVSKMVHQCRSQDEINAVHDKFGTITYAKDLLEKIRQLLRTPFFGTCHVANQGICSRYDIALEIARILKSPIKVNPVSSDQFPLPAPRSRCEALRNYKLELMGLNTLPTWQEALREYLTEWLPI